MESENNTTEVKKIEISVELLQNIRNLLEVASGRINWKLEELYPVGITVQQMDEILKKYTQDK